MAEFAEFHGTAGRHLPVFLVALALLTGLVGPASARRRYAAASRHVAAARLLLPPAMIFHATTPVVSAATLPAELVAVEEGVAVPADALAALSTGSGASPAAQGRNGGSVPAMPEGAYELSSNQDQVLLPFEDGVGAAAFASGPDVFVVLDVARPLDLSALADGSITDRASVTLLRDATVIRLPGKAGGNFSISRVPAGWLISASGPVLVPEPVTISEDGPSVKFAMSAPGLCVRIIDPGTGHELLVGTVTGGSAAIAETQQRGVVVIERTILGVVIDPLSDHLDLRPEAAAFRLGGSSSEALGVARGNVGWRAMSDPPAGRLLGLRDGSLQALDQSFQEAKGAAAAAPAQSRFAPRIIAAEAALALGDGVQAATIVNVALADDQAGAQSVRGRLINAAASLLRDEFRGTEILDNPNIPERSELALWRGVKIAMQDTTSAEAARLLAANLSLLESYPAPLRRRLVPLAAETLVRAGSDAQAALVDTLAGEAGLAFPRALLAARRGKTQASGAALARLAQGSDLRQADEAVEELARIGPRAEGVAVRQRADALEARLLDARISGHEREALRLLEDLRERAGQWSDALRLVREMSRLDPADQAEASRRGGRALLGLASSPAPVSGAASFDQAALIEANADLVPSGADGAEVSLALSDRLVALDLPEQATPIIQGLLRSQPTGSARAALGIRAAALALQLNDSAGALAALANTEADGLPPDQAAARALLKARALSGEGKAEQAISLLEPLQTTDALDLKSRLLATRGDWKGATDALVAFVQKTASDPSVAASVRQDVLLRLASMASRSGDVTRMAKARALAGDRLNDAAKSTLFRVLTSDPKGDGMDLEKLSSSVANLSGTSAADTR